MNDASSGSYSTLQQVGLVLLRTLIGWHFLYEGYYKLSLPAWGSEGNPLGRWTSAGYLKGAVGPFAAVFHRMGESAWTPWIDRIIIFGLLLVGLSLVLGLLTQLGCVGALVFLTLFYVSAIPLRGVPQTGNEGTYLLVNKNLIEWVAVLLLYSFRTGAIAGLDVLWRKSGAGRREPQNV